MRYRPEHLFRNNAAMDSIMQLGLHFASCLEVLSPDTYMFVYM